MRTEEYSNTPVQAQAQSQQTETSQYVGRDLIHGDGFSWSAEKENIVKGPYDYLESHPGKDVRSQLINAFNLWLQVPEPQLAIINKVVGMLHTASLLIDDVEDSSNLRRGVPVAHLIFGTAQTINSANYVYFCALQEIAKLENPEAIRIYTDELLNLHRGQGMDLFWRDTLTCPSEDDYLEMVGNKTGGLFRLAIKLMSACSEPHQQQHRLRPPRQHHRPALPNPRRLPQPLAPNLHRKQRALRGPDRRQVLVPHHPRHPRQPGEPRSDQYPEAEARRRRGQEVRRRLHGVGRLVRVYTPRPARADAEGAVAC
jgi:hypothetical protein